VDTSIFIVGECRKQNSGYAAEHIAPKDRRWFKGTYKYPDICHWGWFKYVASDVFTKPHE